MSVIVTDKGFAADDLGPFTPLEDRADERLILLPNDSDVADVRPIFNQIDAIAIPFPSFSDGRGFSLAHRLRVAGFTGRLRAVGHLISDQYYHARRAGFDEVEISDDLAARQPEADWKAETDWNRETYQDRLFARA